MVHREQTIYPQCNLYLSKIKIFFKRLQKAVCLPLQTSQNQNLTKLQFLIVKLLSGLLVVKKIIDLNISQN